MRNIFFAALFVLFLISSHTLGMSEKDFVKEALKVVPQQYQYYGEISDLQSGDDFAKVPTVDAGGNSITGSRRDNALAELKLHVAFYSHSNDVLYINHTHADFQEFYRAFKQANQSALYSFGGILAHESYHKMAWPSLKAKIHSILIQSVADASDDQIREDIISAMTADEIEALEIEIKVDEGFQHERKLQDKVAEYFVNDRQQTILALKSGKIVAVVNAK